MATKHGYKLVYAPRAEIAHPARKLYRLVKKQYRVGRGQFNIWLQSRTSKIKYAKVLLQQIMIIPLDSVNRAIEKKKIKLSNLERIRLYFAAWICRAATAFGNIVSVLKSNHSIGK